MSANAGRIVVACTVISMLALACGRRAEIFGEEQPRGRERDSAVDRAGSNPNPTPPDGGVPVLVEAGLEFEGGACATRLVTCPSTSDFPCQRNAWYGRIVERCRESAGCVRGWLSIRLEGAGCASELGMTDPNPAFVACVVEQLKLGRCPCPAELTNVHLGVDCP